MEELFYILFDYTFVVVVLGASMLGLVSGVVGGLAFLKKESLLGDAVSHCALAGVACAFLITGQKNILILTLGAFISGMLGMSLIILIVGYSKLKFDSALSVVLSFFFGAGIVLMTFIKKIPNAKQAGLNQFIYGKASSMLLFDVYVIFISASIILFTIFFIYKELKISIFDEEFANTSGFNTKIINMIISVMMGVCIMIGIQTVGVVLMSALLIAPSVAARQLTNKMGVFLILSGFFGVISALFGTVTSSLFKQTPTGPVIVLFATFFAISSMLFAKKRGIIYRFIKRTETKRKLIKETRE